jgi:hypothetical protein
LAALNPATNEERENDKMRSNQAEVRHWINRVFTESELVDIPERALRVLEEALELAQACDVKKEHAHKLIDYVYSRPKGDYVNETAGVMVTLYALAEVCRINAQYAFDCEIHRINDPEVIARVQRRQFEKREAIK